MTSILLSLTGAQAWATVDGPLTSGMVGIPVTIEYDEAWDGLTKNLMCRCSPWGSNNGEIRTLLNVGDTSTVAHEVMQPDLYLYLGVEGFNDDGALVIPTTWAMCGKIEYGANTGADLSTDPELPIWNQLQTEVEQIKRDGYTQEQLEEIQDYVRSASQAAASAEKSRNNATAASNLAVSNANLAEIYMKQAQTAAENAGTSAGSAANLANETLRLQKAAEDAAKRAEEAVGSSQNLNLSVETISNDIEVVGVGSISLDYSEVTLSAGQTMMLACMVSPSNATNTAIRWESENESVATVDNGLVTAVGAGSTAITAISEDNPSARATCAVSVAAGENTVYFASLAMQDGMYKTDGSLNTGIHGHYIIPYIEGMEIHTVQSGMFEGNGYKPFFVRSKSTGALTAVAGYSSEPCSDFPKYQSTYSHFWVTLNGHSPDEVEVVVNANKATDVGSDTVSNYKDYYKYSLAG